MENSSPNQSSEGPSGFSDSDMSADESLSADKSRIASLVQEKRVNRRTRDIQVEMQNASGGKQSTSKSECVYRKYIKLSLAFKPIEWLHNEVNIQLQNML